MKRTFHSALLFALWTLPLLAQQSQYTGLISRADALVKQADYVGALGAAQKAIRLNDSDFRGYYYAAFALYKQNLLTEAEPFVDRALALAPAADKPDVEELVNAIHNSGSYQAEVQQGDQAMQNGQTAVAAEAYTKAWEARRNDQKTGIKAAKLWGDRLNEFGKANQILQYIVDHPGDPDTLAQAQQLLTKYRPSLTAAYSERMDRGIRMVATGDWDQAKAVFEDAISANPEEYSAHLQLARVYAHERDTQGAIRELKAVAANPNANSEAVISFIVDYKNKNDFFPLFMESQFIETLRSGFGTAAASRIEQERASVFGQYQNSKRRLLEVLVGRWTAIGPAQGQIDISTNGEFLVASGSFNLEERDYRKKLTRRVSGQVASIQEIASPAASSCLGYFWPDTTYTHFEQRCYFLNGSFQGSGPSTPSQSLSRVELWDEDYRKTNLDQPHVIGLTLPGFPPIQFER